MIRRALALILGAGILAALALAWIFAPHALSGGEVFVDVSKGAGTRTIAALLAENGVIQNPLQLLLVRALRPKARLQAGEYLFKQTANPWQVFDRIARGDIFYYALVVPEGQNLYDIAATLENQRILPGAAFLEAAYDPAPIRDLDPNAPTLEGYLFPDTYRVTRHTTPAQLCRQMTDRFRKAWRQLGPPQANVHDSVTLASLIEKEAKIPSERPLIASVFLNRLRIGMPLQCDPTTVYAAIVQQRYRGAIYRSDLENKQVYNTYRHAGLPPGPIANPGLASLRAALDPAATDYLYFVARADGSGSHQFSKELAQHARAVREYRRGLRSQPPTI